MSKLTQASVTLAARINKSHLVASKNLDTFGPEWAETNLGVGSQIAVACRRFHGLTIRIEGQTVNGNATVVQRLPEFLPRGVA
jgi:hypothetical protein